MFGLRAAKWISKCIRRHFIARALKRSRAVTIVSRSLEPELHTAGIQSAIVIHNGVQFSPPHSKEHTYATGEYFLYLGRIDPDKFVGDLIDLYEQTQIDVPLLIAGDGAERTRLENSCQDARIRFIGHIDRTELPQLIERAKAFVTASAFETFCLPVIEAAAAGRPSIGPDSGAFPEVVRDGITGYLYSANDPQSFAHAIERIAAMSPADVQTMGNQCQNWAGNFSWPECVAKYEAVYDSVVRSSEV